jgi:hypothetical protein
MFKKMEDTDLQQRELAITQKEATLIQRELDLHQWAK